MAEEREQTLDLLHKLGDMFADVDVNGVPADDMERGPYAFIPRDFKHPDLPTFAEAFAALESGDGNGIVSRTFAYEGNQIPMEAQLFLMQFLRRYQIPHRLLEHTGTIDPAEKAILLETAGQPLAEEIGLLTPVHALRTVTFKMGDTISWVSGITDRIVNDDIAEQIADFYRKKGTAMSGKKVKNAKTNPSDRIYTMLSGTEPGSSSPFMYAMKAGLIDGSFIVLADRPGTQAIEVQFTPDTSLIMPYGALPEILHQHAERFLDDGAAYTFLTAKS